MAFPARSHLAFPDAGDGMLLPINYRETAIALQSNPNIRADMSSYEEELHNQWVARKHRFHIHLSALPKYLSNLPTHLARFPNIPDGLPRSRASFPKAWTTFPSIRSTFPGPSASFPTAPESFPEPPESFPCLGKAVRDLRKAFPRSGKAFPGSRQACRRSGLAFPRSRKARYRRGAARRARRQPSGGEIRLFRNPGMLSDLPVKAARHRVNLAEASGKLSLSLLRAAGMFLGACRT
uniref:Uncharacterized protein n=1 Tax=Candidatus Kentrum sp. DK TaxID=2126562 RepID=A0A450T9P3_9GAMM|nr:MAG: hypothetical protein BECKDK2373B_GA0170837_11261 [Candidatus Kentron sp. DK]